MPVRAILSDDQIRELVRIGTTAPTSFHEYGLSMAAVSSNVALELSQPLRTGLLHINDQTANDEVANPFGVVGASANSSVAGDLGDPTTAQRVISESVARFGLIDTLVNNAGIYIGQLSPNTPSEDSAVVMNVNMAGFFYMTQRAIAEMEKHSSGHVVSVTTSIDQVAISGIYSVLAAMTKGGLNAATKSLARSCTSTADKVLAAEMGHHLGGRK